LADLALLGRVWVETEQSGVRISLRHRLGGLRAQGTVGYRDAVDHQVRILLEQCHALNALDEEQGLVIEDRFARPLVSIRREADTHQWPLRLLLTSWGARGQRLTLAPSEPEAAPMATLQRHAVGRLQRDVLALERSRGKPDGQLREQPELGFRDLAELSGYASWHPSPHTHAGAGIMDRAIAVDPSLVSCALETLVDQVHPLALTAGSNGWVSRSIQQFYAHAYVDGQLRLRGDHARLELNLRAIDSAWVVGQQEPGMDRRSLRLYDSQGRAMAIIASAAHPGAERAALETSRADPIDASGLCARRRLRRNEARLWTTLMNALTS
jgi:hypothetical protein